MTAAVQARGTINYRERICCRLPGSIAWQARESFCRREYEGTVPDVTNQFTVKDLHNRVQLARLLALTYDRALRVSRF